jgi:hypothetical protein
MSVVIVVVVMILGTTKTEIFWNRLTTKLSCEHGSSYTYCIKSSKSPICYDGDVVWLQPCISHRSMVLLWGMLPALCHAEQYVTVRHLPGCSSIASCTALLNRTPITALLVRDLLCRLYSFKLHDLSFLTVLETGINFQYFTSMFTMKNTNWLDVHFIVYPVSSPPLSRSLLLHSFLVIPLLILTIVFPPTRRYHKQPTYHLLFSHQRFCELLVVTVHVTPVFFLWSPWHIIWCSFQ